MWPHLMCQRFEATPEASPDCLGMTGSTGSERCFCISAGPEVMSRFPGSEGQWGTPHSFGFWAEDLTSGCGVCGRDPAWRSLSGDTPLNVASFDGAVTWVVLEMDSWDFLMNLTSVWGQLWSREITLLTLKAKVKTIRVTSGFFSAFLYLCGNQAVYLYGGNGVHAVQHWCPSSILARWFSREATSWHGAISGGHRSHLPLEELKNNIDISSHSGLQSGKQRDKCGHYQYIPTIYFVSQVKLEKDSPVELRVQNLQSWLQFTGPFLCEWRWVVRVADRCRLACATGRPLRWMIRPVSIHSGHIERWRWRRNNLEKWFLLFFFFKYEKCNSLTES